VSPNVCPFLNPYRFLAGKKFKKKVKKEKHLQSVVHSYFIEIFSLNGLGNCKKENHPRKRFDEYFSS
jgi:hypothetical protein